MGFCSYPSTQQGQEQGETKGRLGMTLTGHHLASSLSSPRIDQMSLVQSYRMTAWFLQAAIMDIAGFLFRGKARSTDAWNGMPIAFVF